MYIGLTCDNLFSSETKIKPRFTKHKMYYVLRHAAFKHIYAIYARIEFMRSHMRPRNKVCDFNKLVANPDHRLLAARDKSIVDILELGYTRCGLYARARFTMPPKLI